MPWDLSCHRHAAKTLFRGTLRRADDTEDAGETGIRHPMTMLHEIVPAGKLIMRLNETWALP